MVRDLTRSGHKRSVSSQERLSSEKRCFVREVIIKEGLFYKRGGPGIREG